MTTTTIRPIAASGDWQDLAPTTGRSYHRAATSLPGDRRSRPLPRNEILIGDASSVLATLPGASIDTVVTSPPYYLLRNYAADGQLGVEPDVHGWVNSLLAVFDELARVVKPTGNVWLNVADSYSRHRRFGAAPKSLLLGPERLLLALAERGWIIRNNVIWAKPNPMPSSVSDRLSCTWEAMYFLTRSRAYYFDLDRVRVPHRSRPSAGVAVRPKYDGRRRPAWAGPLAGSNDGLLRARAEGRAGHRLGKNPGDVWSIPTAAYRGAHFATFPPGLVERPLLATCPERTCTNCGMAWRPVHGGVPTKPCHCDAGWQSGVVLDPFMGAGTTAVVAQKLGRDWIGIELNPAYRDLALKRLATSP